MVSNENLKAARQAIEAELSHAKEGMAYYMSRVEALEIALQQLENVGDVESISSKGTKPSANAKGAKINGRKRGRKARGWEQASSANGAAAAEADTAKKRSQKPHAKSADDADSLPPTGGDFWLNLVSAQPQSAVDISNAAISALGITPEQKGRIQKLKQRVSPALASLVSAQKIKDSGAGRERRFFKEKR